MGQLIIISKKENSSKENISLNSVLEEMLNYAMKCVDNTAGLTIVNNVPDGLWNVDVDKSQVEQVIYKLIVNGIQSIDSKGTLTINAKNCLKRDSENSRRSLKKYVEVSVTDCRFGIAPEVRDKISDLYFMTEEKVTGLDLAAVHSIIEKHGGSIHVDSIPGQEFTVTFSIPASSKHNSAAEAERNIKVIAANKRIMIMDDDLVVKNLLERLLVKLGFEVCTVAKGEDALRLYEDSLLTNPIDLIIMDLNIQNGMGGKETIMLFNKLKYNEVKKIVFSGYSNDPVVANYLSYGFDGVLNKPFTNQELITILSKVLIEKVEQYTECRKYPNV
jgi:CheY-like chemotaxis protein